MSKAPPRAHADLVEAEAPTALVRLDPQALIAHAVKANANIETIEKLVALAERVRAVQAREAWHHAIAEFQRQCPIIAKTKTARIPTRSGAYTYTYAPLDEILRVVRPVMAPLGLSIAWKSGKVDGTSVSVVCQVAHRLGHVEDSGLVTVPVSIGDDARGANPAQRVASAMTYAKRYSLLGILGLAPEEDDDADGAAGDDDRRRPTEAERGKLTADAARLATERNLSTEERLELTKSYLHGQPMNKATVEDLDQLQMFLGDPAAVGQWRAERARDLEDGKP